MTNKFPHLAGSNPTFPGLGDPYAQGDNTFDYNRWGEGTKLTLCRVPWDATTNVVDWTTTDPKSYFDGLQNTAKITLNTEINVQPDGSVRLPVPIANVQRWNYLWVELEPMTSAAQPLDYADGPALRNIGYFVRDAVQVTPSTTECHLEVDWWTNSLPFTHVSYMTLERGHAPLAAVSADEYLADPLHNNSLLLTEDVNYGEPVITKHSQLELWTATTEPLVCFALSCSLDQLAAMLTQAGTAASSEWTDPTFTDTDDRWGKQWQVNDYAWGDSTKYKDTTTETTPWLTGTGLPGYTLIAVNATDATAFLDYVQEHAPQLMQLMKASFAVPAMMLSTKQAGTAGSVTYYEVLPLNQLPPVPVELKKSDFDYPAEYADLAKLYTSPYAKLTFSDNDGHSVDVRVECTSGLKIDRRVSLAFPYLRAQAFLEGVNGTGSNSLTWVDVNGLQHDSSMPATNWQETMLSFDVPTYALVADGYRQWLMKNSRQNEAKRLQALNSYHNSVRSGNTGTENTRDGLATSLANTLRSNTTALENGTRSNETGNTNTLASLNTGNENTLASNTLALENGTRSNDTGNTNTLASIDNSYTTTKNNIELARQNTARSNATTFGIALENANTRYRNEQASAATALANATGSAGTGYTNASNSADLSYNNTKRSADAALASALASNATTKANGDRSNDTGTANALASAGTALANANRSADAARTAVTNSTENATSVNAKQTGYNTATNTQLQSYANTSFANRMSKMEETTGDYEGTMNIRKVLPNFTESSLTDFVSGIEAAAFAGDEAALGRLIAQANIDEDAVANGATTNDLLLAQTILNSVLPAYQSGRARNKNIQQMVLSAATGLLSVAGAGAAVAAAGKAAADGAASMSTLAAANQLAMPAAQALRQNVEYVNTVSNEQASTYLISGVNMAKTALSAAENSNQLRIAKKQDGKQLKTDLANATKNTELGNGLSTDLTALSNALATKNGDLAQQTAKANAAASNATAVANANRSSDTTAANLAASKETADSNANRSYTATMSNAEYSKGTALTNAENSKNRAVANATASNKTALANAERSYNVSTNNSQDSYDTTVANLEATAKNGNTNNGLNKATSTANQKRTYDTTTANLAASKTTADANANRSLETGTANQGRSYETTTANLQASKTTADANATDSNTTSVANAGYSQDSALSAAQNDLRTTQAVAKLSIEAHKNDAPVTVGETTGDPLPDYFGTRGVQVRVQTQPEGAIRSAGSQFLRYGYRLDQSWPFERWSVMSRFSYWQAKDVWLTGETSIAELGKDAIRAILAQGVTVWASPDLVCTGSTSENKPL